MSRPNPAYRPPLRHPRPRGERLLLALLAPVLHYLDHRFDRLENRMSSAEQTFETAMSRFAQVQSDGFAAVRTRLAELVAAAARSGDETLTRAAARVDAGVDALAGGFAEFAAAAPVEVPDAQIPPVINPETPPVEQTDPGAGEGLPVDPVEVIDDPNVPTPNDTPTTSS